MMERVFLFFFSLLFSVSNLMNNKHEYSEKMCKIFKAYAALGIDQEER